MHRQLFVWLLCVSSIAIGCAKEPTVATDDHDATPGDVSPDSAIIDTIDTFDASDATTIHNETTIGVDLSGDVTEPTTCSGGSRCPCKVDADCDGNQCLETATGRVCAQSCNEGSGCLATEVCLPIGTGSDVVKYCIPRWVSICSPCLQNSDCAYAGNGGAICASLGAAGNFCTANCTAGTDCPPSFDCLNGVCRPVDDACTCSPLGRRAPRHNLVFGQSRHRQMQR